MQSNWKQAEKILKNGGIVVAPTDTLYGILASVKYKKTIEKIYKTKGRDENKPYIILISSFSDLDKFNIKLTIEQKDFLKKYWPSSLSVILPCKLKKFSYLHREQNSLAFRMIGKDNKDLFNLIKKVGPLVAPSVNPQGGKPAINIKQAQKYFGNVIDLYIDEGIRKSKPSTLVSLENKQIKVLRQGMVKIVS